MGKPDFFIVGAPKAGTTSIYHYLNQHPEIEMPSTKEIHYFSGKDLNKDYYKTKYPEDINSYEALFDSAGEGIISGDVSPSYLYYSHVAKDIYHYNIKAKIIILVRNPVSRAISHYMMDVQKGFQNKPLDEFLSETVDNKPYYFQYIECGKYGKYVKQYFDLFGRENVHVVAMEDFFRDPEAEMRMIFELVGVDKEFCVNSRSAHNVYTVPMFSFMRGLRANSFAYNIFRGLSKPLQSWIKSVFLKEGEKPSFDNEKDKLYKIYLDDVAFLSDLTGVDFQEVWFAQYFKCDR